MSTLAKVLAQIAKLEGKGGNPVTKIDDAGHYLRQRGFYPHDSGSNSFDDVWEILHESNPEERLGHFTLKGQHAAPHAEMTDAYIFEPSRRKGLGTAAYRRLADYYGGIISDAGQTSAAATRVYDKLAPGSLAEHAPGFRQDPINAVNQRRLYIPGRPGPRPKGWGIFGEDD
jgi:hypothetical protein